MGEVDSGCLAGFRHVGGASRPPEVPLTGSVRGEEQRGEGVVVDGEWSRAGDRRGPSLARRRRSWRWWLAVLRKEEGEVGKQRRERSGPSGGFTAMKEEEKG